MDPTDELCAVLADETRACEALAAVLADEQGALVALRPEAVLACVEQRVSLARELVRLAARRRALVRDTTLSGGRTASSARDLLPHLSPAPQARLEGALRSLRRALLAARTLERRNAQLAVSGLDSVEEMLRALQSVTPGTRYRADARLDPPAGARVDRRA